MRNTIICICNDYSKPVINTINCEQIAATRDEIFEKSKEFNGFILDENTITFDKADNFTNFWAYIMRNYIK